MVQPSDSDSTKLWNDLDKFFQEDYQEIMDKQEKLEGRLKLLDSQIRRIDGQINRIDGKIDRLNRYVDNYVEKHDKLTERLNKLDLRVLDNEQKIKSLQEPPEEEILTEEKNKSLVSTGQNDNNSPHIISW